MGEAARRWAEALRKWAIPDEVAARAPASPYAMPPKLFRAPGGPPADTPSRRRALEALGAGGTVLDVGAGGGAAGLALVPPATAITAVDESADMVAEFVRAAGAAGVAHAEHVGRWPDVAPEVAPADVVVCHHVIYNVADLGAFVSALTVHARRRVVVEMSETHPLSDLNALWMHFHALARPTRPTLDDAMAVLEEEGVPAEVERFARAPRTAPLSPERVAFVRSRLCLGADRDPEIASLLAARRPAPRRVAALWWPGAAGGKGGSGHRAVVAAPGEDRRWPR